MENEIIKQNAELSTSKNIDIYEALTIFKSYKVDAGKTLEKDSLSWKPRLYISVVRNFLFFISDKGLTLTDFAKNTYTTLLEQEKKLKNIKPYKTAINKFLKIAEANKFLGATIINNASKKTIIETELMAYFEAYLKYGQGKVKTERTKNNYRASFKEFARWCDATNLNAFSYAVIREYVSNLNGLVGKGDISVFTANTYLAPLRQFSKFLIQESTDIFKNKDEQQRIKIEKDLNKILLVPNLSVNNSEDFYKDSLTHEEVLKVINKAGNSKEKLIIALMYFTGLRSFEVLKVKFSDFNFKSSELTVIGKGNKKASIPFAYCAKALKGYVDNYIRQYKPNVEKSLFDEWKDTANIRRFVNKILESLDLKKKKKKVSTHSFRHSLVQNLLLNNVPLVLVQKIARHENISTTEKYFKKIQSENLLQVPQNILGN